MGRCSVFRQWMVEKFLEGLDTQREAQLKDHLQVCPQCRQEQLQLDELMGSFQSENRELPEEYWTTFWKMVERNIRDAERNYSHRETRRFPFWQKWPFQLAAAITLLVVGGLVGRFFLTPRSTDQTLQKMRIGRVEVLDETARYLEQSKILLLGFVNLDLSQTGPEDLDFSYEQQVSVQLVKRLPELRSQLEQLNEQHLIALLEDLEVVLLQIANADQINNPTEIELIQSGVNTRAILFKINLEQMSNTKNRFYVKGENTNI